MFSGWKSESTVGPAAAGQSAAIIKGWPSESHQGVAARLAVASLAKPKWRARLATIMPRGFVELSRSKMSLLMSSVLLLAGWSAIYFNRSAYIVEGTIRAVVERTYPWDVGGRFDIVLELGPDRWLRIPSLHGTCPNLPRLAGACVKPEFPIGGAIRLEVYSFADPNFCPDLGRYLSDFRCPGGTLGRTGRRHAFINAIEVGGKPVLTGWSPNLSVLALYGFIVAVSGLLAWHKWQLSTIRTRTLIVYALMLWGCILWPLARYF